jgi:hypothetical protein
VRLARGAADVDAVGPRPADDRQAAGESIAAERGAGVAEQREAHAPGGDRDRELLRRDELTALTVGEDQHGASLASDQLSHLGGCAGGEPAARAGVVQVRGERVDPRGRHRARAPGVLRAVAYGGDRGGGGNGEHGGESRDAESPMMPGRQRDAGAEACGDRGVHAGEIARSQLWHRAGQRKAGEKPECERGESSAGDAVLPA